MADRVVGVLGGGLVDPTAPLVRADDLGVLRGDGCFESMLVIDGDIVALPAHLARLARSAASLELPAPDQSAWRELARRVTTAWGRDGEAVLRLILTRGPEGGPTEGGPTGFAIVGPLPPDTLRQREHGVHVLALSRGLPSGLAGSAPWLLAGVKTLSYAVNMAALRHARSCGADDVIMTSAEGRVLEGPTSTVLWAVGDTLHTIPSAEPILAGTTIDELFGAAPGLGLRTALTTATVPDLLAADGAWLISSIRRVAAVRSLDGRPLPDCPLDETIRGVLLRGT